MVPFECVQDLLPGERAMKQEPPDLPYFGEVGHPKHYSPIHSSALSLVTFIRLSSLHQSQRAGKQALPS